jgi:hypothetical protein
MCTVLLFQLSHSIRVVIEPFKLVGCRVRQISNLFGGLHICTHHIFIEGMTIVFMMSSIVVVHLPS